MFARLGITSRGDLIRCGNFPGYQRLARASVWDRRFGASAYTSASAWPSAVHALTVPAYAWLRSGAHRAQVLEHVAGEPVAKGCASSYCEVGFELVIGAA